MEKYQKQIKSILFLAWPAIIQEAMNVVVSYVDTAMVGALGANASAAVGLTSTVCWLVTSIAIAFGVGILAVCAQAVGANNQEKVQRTGQQALFYIDSWVDIDGYLCGHCSVFARLVKWCTGYS
ncbi:MATE family efflux transporter [Coprobacillaceae bacterium CR2/5/TPMF4]|nr:MATE family efflux transporter [Coprobacillaceae bacterium CR2/5/TPMF4]